MIPAAVFIPDRHEPNKQNAVWSLKICRNHKALNYNYNNYQQMGACIIVFCPTAMDCRGFNIHILFSCCPSQEPVNNTSKQECDADGLRVPRLCLPFTNTHETQQYQVFTVIKECQQM